MKPVVRPFPLLAAILLLLPGLVQAQAPAVNLRRTPTVEVIEKTKNSVVSITSTVNIVQRSNPFGNDPYFRNFDRVDIVPGDSLGSGFVVHPDGYVITNNHVVDRAITIAVKFVDGRSFTAKCLSADAAADLAILKIQADTKFPALELGDSSDLLIGEPVIAVGNPLGYSHSVSTGIISAIHRDLQAGGRGAQLADLIQTDAAINPGNSGGPLLNAYGQVIGINTAIRGDAQNIGFAIQVNALRDLIPDLMAPAQISQLDIPLKLKEKRTITPPARVQASVLRANDGAPVALIAGTRPRDIVDAYAILLKQTEGKPFEVTFDGKPKVRIDPKAVATPEALVKARERLGITVEQVTPAMAARMGLSIEEGMYVREVVQGSTSDKIGIKPGDVLVSMGQFRVRSLKIFEILMQSLPQSGRVRVGILRGPALAYGLLEL